MNSARAIFLFVAFSLISCQPEHPNYGFVEVSQYSNSSVYDTIVSKYSIWRTKPFHMVDDRLLIMNIYNQTPSDGFEIILQNYKAVGTYPLSLGGNQMCDYGSSMIPNDLLYGTMEILEADSVHHFLKATFNGTYIPNINDTIFFGFTNGYMEVYY